jgi:hypothetical protein
VAADACFRSGTTFARLGEEWFANADTPLEVNDILAD